VKAENYSYSSDPTVEPQPGELSLLAETRKPSALLLPRKDALAQIKLTYF